MTFTSLPIFSIDVDKKHYPDDYEKLSVWWIHKISYINVRLDTGQNHILDLNSTSLPILSIDVDYHKQFNKMLSFQWIQGMYDKRRNSERWKKMFE